MKESYECEVATHIGPESWRRSALPRPPHSKAARRRNLLSLRTKPRILTRKYANKNVDRENQGEAVPQASSHRCAPTAAQYKTWAARRASAKQSPLPKS